MYDNIAQKYKDMTEYKFHDLTHPDHYKEAIELATQEFKEHGGGYDATKEILQKADPKLSIGMSFGGKLVGAYLMHSQDMPNVGGPSYNQDIRGKIGKEGLGLAIQKEHRNKGLGNKMKDMSIKDSTHDYMWGYQLSSLNNLDDWKKRRKVAYSDDNIHVTYQPTTK